MTILEHKECHPPLDVAIIGAGPCGLFTAFQASMLGLKCAIFDTLPEVGGQCRALYPDKPIYDIPACPKITGGALIDNLIEQISPFNIPIVCNTTIEKWNYNQKTSLWILGSNTNNTNHSAFSNDPDSTSSSFNSNNNITAKTVIIAAGGGAFGPNRPPLENLELFEGKNIFYAVNNPNIFRGKRVVIAGGGDSAVDWTIELANVAEKVSLIHRRAKFRALPHSVEKLQKINKDSPDKLELVVPFNLHSLLIGSEGQFRGIKVEKIDGTIKEIECDYLLLFFGLSMDNKSLHDIPNIKWSEDQRHIDVNPATMMTDSPGIFAVGDICSYPGKLKLILTGFAEAALACHTAYSIVNPHIPLHFEYSTSKGIPENKSSDN